MSRKQVTFYMDEDIFEQFKKRYPNIISVFFRRVVNRCLIDPKYFQDIFFETPDNISLDKQGKVINNSTF